ncbi:MAG: S8 family serine peptidase [Phycisphaerae bacterium]|nr:S8 family serine peptidase [Gemmatimonadaceae bacterium]
MFVLQIQDISIVRKLSFVVLSSFVLASCKDSPSAPEIQPRANIVPSSQTSSYIVVLKPGASALAPAMRNMMSAVSTVDYTYSDAINGYAAHMTAATAASLQNNPAVLLVELDAPVSINGGGVQSPATWGLDRLDQVSLPMNNSYSYPSTGSGVSVYILDTGIRASHNEYGGRAVAAFSAIAGGPADCHGHGTHVAGTIGGTTYGVAKQVRLYGVRVLDCSGNGMNSGVIAGINWVTANAVRPAVANMSLSGGMSGALDAAVQGSIASGITYAIAAGNSSTNACNESPGRTPLAITVAASSSSDTRASFSNFGPCVDIFAPGVSITAAGLSSDVALATMSGTSMASPHVAGVAALYLSMNPTSTPAQVTAGLLAAARSGKVQDLRGSADLLLALPAAVPVNAAPVANFTVSCTVMVCSMNGTSSTDDNGVTSYAWSMPGALVSVATGPTAIATFLAPGTKNITLTVTDGAGLTNSKTTAVSLIAPNQAPSATITAPAAGASVVQGTAVTFAGTGSDPEDGTLSGVSLTWSSSINGAMGAGAAASVNTLSVGAHVITLTSRDAQGLTGTATVTLNVTAAPVVNKAPVSRFTVTCALVICTVDASTSSDDAAVVSYTWTWGNGKGRTITFPVASVGYAASAQYVITLTVADAAGLKHTSSQPVVVSSVPPINLPPNVSVLTPVSNANYTAGATIGFSGNANDPEDGILAGSSLTWSSNLAGVLGTGTSVNTAGLQAGTHVVTLTAVDSKGLSATASVQLVVLPPPPPIPVARFTASCTAMTCSVDASTSSDDVGIVSYTWTWGNGKGRTVQIAAVTASYAGPGTYTITLTVRDAAGNSHSVARSVTVL